ncbi:hypothetical protein FBU59_002141 [Linderina macrospora]|uniref:Uncharacterized protein n=1 Tax=Linderina macrospora TaxID=4868 RepID=A0ACC1JBU4_9FUNG|nr:hypothetical protein FBU59_002141 [Linderina macrospora]
MFASKIKPFFNRRKAATHGSHQTDTHRDSQTAQISQLADTAATIYSTNSNTSSPATSPRLSPVTTPAIEDWDDDAKTLVGVKAARPRRMSPEDALSHFYTGNNAFHRALLRSL